MPRLFVHVPTRAGSKIDTTISGFRVEGSFVPGSGGRYPRAIHPIKRHAVPGLSSSIGAFEIISPLQESVWASCVWVTFEKMSQVDDAVTALNEAITKQWGLTLRCERLFHRKMTPNLGKNPAGPGQMFLDIQSFPSDWGVNDENEFSDNVLADIAWPGCLVNSENDDCTWSMGFACEGVQIATPVEAKRMAGILECASVASSNLWWLNCYASACVRPPFDEWSTTWNVIDNISALVDLAVRAYRGLSIDGPHHASRAIKGPGKISFDGAGTEFVRFVHVDFESIVPLKGLFAAHNASIQLLAKLREKLRNPAAHQPWPINRVFMELGSVPYVIGTTEAQAAAEGAYRLSIDIANRLKWFDTPGLRLAKPVRVEAKKV